MKTLIKQVMWLLFKKMTCSFCRGWHKLEQIAPSGPDEEGYYTYYTTCGGYYDSKNPNLIT